MSRPQMRPMSTGERERLQAHHAGAMQDRCRIGSLDAPLTACRRVVIPAEPIALSTGFTPGVEFHLPVDTELPADAPIFLVSIHGEAISPPVEYIQTAVPERGVVAVTVQARRREV